MDISELYFKNRIELARQGRDEDLDILVHDEAWDVRWFVACHGRPQDLDILVHDEADVVRVAVAARGRDEDLDILVRDESPYVREAVADQGRDKDLDILVNDEDSDVREAVAEHGRSQDLDILVYDENSGVRIAVAKCALLKYFTILSHDKDDTVRYFASKYGYKENLEALVVDGIYGNIEELAAENEKLKQGLMAVADAVYGVKDINLQNYDAASYDVDIDSILKIAEYQEDRASSPMRAFVESEIDYCLSRSSRLEEFLDEAQQKNEQDFYKDIINDISVYVDLNEDKYVNLTNLKNCIEDGLTNYIETYKAENSIRSVDCKDTLESRVSELKEQINEIKDTLLELNKDGQIQGGSDR